MKSTFALLLLAAALSCSKSNDNPQRSGPLDSNPTATQTGTLQVALIADKSTGPITKYGWGATIWSEVQLDAQNVIKWNPGTSHEGTDFVPITATVPKKGKYNFNLIVYDDAGNKNFDTVSVTVK